MTPVKEAFEQGVTMASAPLVLGIFLYGFFLVIGVDLHSGGQGPWFVPYIVIWVALALLLGIFGGYEAWSWESSSHSFTSNAVAKHQTSAPTVHYPELERELAYRLQRIEHIKATAYQGMGATHLLPQTVGYASAADMIFTGRLVTAQEAREIGLVSRVLSSDQLMEVSIAVAQEIAAKSPSAVRMAKRALVRQKLVNLEAALDYEATAQMSSYTSGEMREALARLRQD